ncbi:hypothetical protein HC766_07015 [Candidatus Gracilibacteria bacterium]|nr:hypothetical protein [Candidatus Gracilibacteria bacterium]
MRGLLSESVSWWCISLAVLIQLSIHGMLENYRLWEGVRCSTLSGNCFWLLNPIATADCRCRSRSPLNPYRASILSCWKGRAIGLAREGASRPFSGRFKNWFFDEVLALNVRESGSDYL